MTKTIFLASNSPIKKKALENAIGEPKVITMDAGPSFNAAAGVPEQPYGLENIKNYAIKRLRYLWKVLEEKDTFRRLDVRPNKALLICAIESGVQKIGDEAYSLSSIQFGRIESTINSMPETRIQYQTFTEMFKLPDWIAYQLQGDTSLTVGKVIKNIKGIDVPNKDVIGYLTEGQISRSDLMTHAINNLMKVNDFFPYTI